MRGFNLVFGGGPIELPMTAQRLMAFLAVNEAPVHRVYVAGMLWPDVEQERANANLRSALWRLQSSGFAFAQARRTHIALSPFVSVDFRDVSHRARRLLDRTATFHESRADIESLSADLLPDWYDDWVLMERERFRQLRLHALESLCEQLTAAGDYASASEAGLAAVTGEPLRESAHRVLIKTYLAEGNASEAVRQYEAYRNLLRKELDLAPSPLIHDLMAAAHSR